MNRDELGTFSAGQSGDIQQLSDVADADSESVVQLLEEGNAFEASAVKGVENAEDPDVSEVTTHQVPEDDVPGEPERRLAPRVGLFRPGFSFEPARSTPMPQSTHNRLAELHNLAAHYHTAAATAHGKGDHLTAHELSRQAHEHSLNVRKLADELAGARDETDRTTLSDAVAALPTDTGK